MDLTAQVSYYPFTKVMYRKKQCLQAALHELTRRAIASARPDGPSGQPVNQPIVNLYNGAAVRQQVTSLR